METEIANTKSTAATSQQVVAIISLLHEPAGTRNSLHRRFRGEAPLAWTLYRLRRSTRISRTVILCWREQFADAKKIAEEMEVHCVSYSPRVPYEQLDAVSASRRWADGWRGGLLGACEFDRGYHGPWVGQILEQFEGQFALLIDPAASLVDADLIDEMFEHSNHHPDIDLFFTPAAPGLNGVMIRKTLVSQLASAHSHPGTLLSYRPDIPLRDPISAPSCAPVPTPLARTRHRFTLDSDRQIDRISSSTVHLNGQLIRTEAERLLVTLDASDAPAKNPREIVLELTPRRNTRPIYWPGSHLSISRKDATLQGLKPLIDQLAEIDDIRIVLAGLGDPLLNAEFFDTVKSIQDAGISAIAIETDLVDVTRDTIDRLIDSSIDIITVHLPAASQATYKAVMGIDQLKQVLENVARLVNGRRAKKLGTPLVVPTFTKTNVNFGEMESWYDHWLRLLGCAVIVGPSDFAEQIADTSVSKMEPPSRKPCSRIAQRLTILSDGRAVSCEQDVCGKHVLGNIQNDSLSKLWNESAQALRAAHRNQQLTPFPLCVKCHDWHRP